MSDVTVMRYEHDMKAAWDDVVADAVNGSIMHSQQFMAYHPATRFQRDDKIIFMKGKPVAVFPLAREVRNGTVFGRSPYAASFGGVVTLPMSSLNAEAVGVALSEALAEEGYEALSLALAPACYETSGNSANYFLLKNSRGWTHDKGLCSVVRFKNRKTSESYRRNVRKAVRYGFAIEEGCDVDALYPILKATLLAKPNGFITHTRQELHRLSELLGERMRTVLAFDDGSPVAGVLLFLEKHGIHCFYNGHLKESADKCPLHAVFEAVIEHYSKQYEWLDLGLTDRVAVPTNRGLVQFKEGMGGEPLYREYFELSLGVGGKHD